MDPVNDFLIEIVSFGRASSGLGANADTGYSRIIDDDLLDVDIFRSLSRIGAGGVYDTSLSGD